MFLLVACGKQRASSGSSGSGSGGGSGAGGTDSTPNPYAGLPVAIDANARLGFDANKIYQEYSNDYPTCESPPATDYGWTPTGGCPAQPIGTQIPLQSYCHIDPNFRVSWWQSNPPTCGDHWPAPSHLLGVNRTPVEREAWVHSMEHGAVILAYNCPKGCDAKLAVLTQAYTARADRMYKVMITPDFNLPADTFAAVSWTWVYRFTDPDLKTLVCFIDEHRNHGRENNLTL